MMLLPINKNPTVRSFAYHIFTDMVCNNAYTNSAEIARLGVPDENVYDWSVFADKTVYEITNSEVRVFSGSNEIKNCFRIYRRLKKTDELIVKIKKHLYTNPWSNISIFIARKKQLPQSDDFEKDQLCATFTRAIGYGYFVHREHVFSQLVRTRIMRFPYYLKMKLDNSIVSFSYNDAGVWKEVGRMEYIYSEDDCVGIDLNIADNQYLNWLYTNFINLQGNLNDEVRLDWINTAKRNYRFYSVNPILTFGYEELAATNVDGLFSQICRYLDAGRYVEIYLNEKYIPGAVNYQKKDHIHENLCYGYDENNRVVYLVNIAVGKPNFIRSSIDDFENGFLFNGGNRFVHTLNFNPDEEYYRLNIQYMVSNLEKYLNGTNISESFGFCSATENKTYGMALYDMLMTDDGVFKLAGDERMAYLLFEHKKIMRDRVRFLYDRRQLAKDVFSKLYAGFQENYRISEILLNVVLKNKVKPSCDIDVRLRGLLNRLKSSELCLISEMIDELNKGDRADQACYPRDSG